MAEEIFVENGICDTARCLCSGFSQNHGTNSWAKPLRGKNFFSRPSISNIWKWLLPAPDSWRWQGIHYQRQLCLYGFNYHDRHWAIFLHLYIILFQLNNLFPYIGMHSPKLYASLLSKGFRMRLAGMDIYLLTGMWERGLERFRVAWVSFISPTLFRVSQRKKSLHAP